MLTSYSAFKDRLISVIKIRSRNFVNTDCDIDALAHIVYNDIISEVNLKWYKQPYVISDEELIVLPANNIVGDDTATVTEFYKRVYDIVDEDDCNITDYIIRTDNDTYRYISLEYRDYNKGKTIYFVRSVAATIETLNLEQYHLILSAMVEGIMYYVQASIPDPNDGQTVNLAYQRYVAEKKKLINKLPQVQYVPKHVRITDGLY